MKTTYALLVLISLSMATTNPTTSQIPTNGSFRLQSARNNSKLIFSAVNDINVVLEINVTKQTSNSFINYNKLISGSSYSSESVKLMENDHYNLSLTTNYISLTLFNNNFKNYANYSASGFYRLHTKQYDQNTEWQSYQLFLSYPNEISIYQSSGGWVNNLTVTLNIIDSTGGDLQLGYSSSDTIMHEYINNTGSFSYTLNASSLFLSLDTNNYSRVIGTYTITDNGQLYKAAPGFELSFGICAIIVVGIFSKFKYERKNNKKV